MTPEAPRLPYPSDLSDAEWRDVAPLISARRSRGRPVSTDFREIFDAIRYRWATGCQWRMLPHDFPPWPTVRWHYYRWRRHGAIDAIREKLKQKRDQVA